MESSKAVCRTVRGDVDTGTGALGRVLAHEHLLGGRELSSAGALARIQA